MKNLAEPTGLDQVRDLAPKSAARLNVLMVSVRYYPFMGGVETHIYEVGRRLVEMGVKVTVLTTNPDGDLPAEEEVNGVTVRRVRSWPNQRDFTVSAELVRQISNGNWDIVHCQGYHTLFSPLAMLAAWRAKKPYLVSFHSGGHSSRLRNAVRGIQREVLRPLLAHAERLVAVSQFEADFFQKQLRLPRDKFVVVPNGAKLPEVPADYTPDHEGELILSVGRLERYKGHHRIIEALPLILKTRPGVRLRIVGGGPYEGELRQLAQQLGVADRVEIGPIPPTDRAGMAKALAGASLVTLLSDYEAHPVAVMEALSMGRPVLVANTSGLQELADRKLVRGIDVKSSPAQVAQAVIEQLDNPLIPASVSLPTWEDCAADLLTLYSTLIRH